LHLQPIFIALVPVESLFMLFCFLHVAIFQRPLDRGDVLLSLSYLPTAERLVLVVVKARNLAWPTTKPAGGKNRSQGAARISILYSSILTAN